MYLTNEIEINSQTLEEIELYDCNNFQTENWQTQFPILDEVHVAQWQEYVSEAADMGVLTTLQQYLVQLQFPIQPGISDHPEYRRVTRQGKSAHNLDLATGLNLVAPDKLKLLIQQTVAGQIPVIVAGDRQDFVKLVQALTRRNEPQAIPDSMGACIIGGYANWHRIAQRRQRFLQKHPQSIWQFEFATLQLQPELYQDRFILLSLGDYSNVAAIDLGLSSQEWQELSWKIRLEHECTHYVTRRLLGSMNNNAFDELIADYQGIVAACGYFRSDWLLRFMGITPSGYQAGGRLENYLGKPALSEAAFLVLQQLVRQAALNLESFDHQYYQHYPRNNQEKLAILMSLTQSSLRKLAAPNAVGELLAIAKRARNRISSSQSKTVIV